MLHERPNVVILWQENRMNIKSPAGESDISLDKEIHVVMRGYTDREERTFKARELGAFMSRGYVIEQLDFGVTRF